VSVLELPINHNKMTVKEYIDKLNARYRSGISTEHSYRADLLGLIEALVQGITITNEPKRVACGAPDYIITRRNIPVGYIEAKDIGADINSKTYKEQFDRYKQSLDNLIITDYLTFQFFVNGSATTSITIGEISGNKIHPIPDNFERFIDLIKNFCEYVGQTIKSAQKLSKMMAAKAKLLSNVIDLALDPENETEGVNELQNINLLSQYESFKQVLIHDITSKAFADIYAQTIAYGMFAARLNDPSLENFTRQEAAELIPKSNPFLRKLFQYIAGYDLDDRIVWIVDALADIFRATNVEEMLKDFGKPTHQTDPFIHFYETFLAEYDPKLRKSRGVWYTPEPVVNFIVRAVDDILKTEFGLSHGLADTSKIKIKVPGQQKKPIEKEVHKVQILDPATGTGTFLAEVIKQIHKKFEGQQGIWSQYVEDHLIPRINGFEILMAPYAMAHLKLEMLLHDSGYRSSKEQRLRVYLTNSLEEHHPDTGTLFASWLSIEANEASHVKRDAPVMVVLGNPPYSGESSNKGKWIMGLMKDYKREPGGTVKLKEKNSKWINDDYVKFLRYGQYLIEKSGEGVLAFINPHGYLDNPTFRGMRWSLLKTYDKIYTLDLHGNSNKKEICPDGTPDINVFDIMQGVSINIFIKKAKSKENGLGKVYHAEIYGTRDSKYAELWSNSIKSLDYKELPNISPEFYFIPKNYSLKSKYDLGFKLNELFLKNGNGIVTKRDNLCIQDTPSLSYKSAHDILYLDKNEFYKKYHLPSDVRDWRYMWAKEDIEKSGLRPQLVKAINYRPFDTKYIYYTGQSRGFVGWPVFQIMRNYLLGDNIGLLCPKAFKDKNFAHVFVTDMISEAIFLSSKTSSNAMNFPLYLYADANSHEILDGQPVRTPNLNKKIVAEISKKLGLKFTPERENSSDTYTPIDLLDYIYAVLHSQSYRTKFNEFLKTGYPIVPYPTSQLAFIELVKLGTELRQLHLLVSARVKIFITSYPKEGANDVIKINYLGNKVWINNEQYFGGISQVAWDFYIGGYQPAQKWLKDRKGRVLSYEDIMHYQKIIVALTETDRIMKEIDKIDFLP